MQKAETRTKRLTPTNTPVIRSSWNQPTKQKYARNSYSTRRKELLGGINREAHIFKERSCIFRLRRNVFHVKLQVVHSHTDSTLPSGGIRLLMKGQIRTRHSRQVSAAS
jgi:hypothetical protein